MTNPTDKALQVLDVQSAAEALDIIHCIAMARHQSDPVAKDLHEARATLAARIAELEAALTAAESRARGADLDPQLATFYGVDSVAGLLAAQEEHIVKLQDAARRNVKPWEDTFPPTLNRPFTDAQTVTDAEKKASLMESLLKTTHARYQWLANRVLACDYGDNDAAGDQIGWRICHNLLAHNGERQPAFMYGPSIDAAIDAAIEAERQEAGNG